MIRPAHPMRSNVLGSWLSFKAISKKYLLAETDSLPHVVLSEQWHGVGSSAEDVSRRIYFLYHANREGLQTRQQSGSSVAEGISSGGLGA